MMGDASLKTMEMRVLILQVPRQGRSLDKKEKKVHLEQNGLQIVDTSTPFLVKNARCKFQLLYRMHTTIIFVTQLTFEQHLENEKCGGI